jgi:outer membrane protein TolC
MFMSLKPSWLVWSALLCSAPPTLFSQEANQQWSEAQVIEQFLSQSPQSRELRARVALAEAEARTRTVYSNPSVSYSRETAGYNEFFEASQILPINGRMRYLREAGTAAVSVAEANREASLWSMRGDLRVGFHRMVAAQERLRLLTATAGDVEKLIELLRKREQEGEGSRYDRMRAEREVSELRIDITAAQSAIASSAARVSAFLAEGTRVQEVRGDLAVIGAPPDLDA